MIEVCVARRIEDVANANTAIHRFTRGREDLRNHVVRLGARRDTSAKLHGLLAELCIGQRAHRWLEGVGEVDDLEITLHIALVLGAHRHTDEPIENGNAFEKLTHVLLYREKISNANAGVQRANEERWIEMK